MINGEGVITQAHIAPVLGVMAVGALPGVMVGRAIVAGLAIGQAGVTETHRPPSIGVVAV